MNEDYCSSQFLEPVGNIFFTAQKVIAANKRRIEVSGFFSGIQTFGLKICRDHNGNFRLYGEQIIDLLTLTTDAAGRDRNLLKHLFMTSADKRYLKLRIANDGYGASPSGGEKVESSDDLPLAFEWSGKVIFEPAQSGGEMIMSGLELPVVLNLQGTAYPTHTVWSARTKIPLDLTISGLNLPFAEFLKAVGNPMIPDMVQIEWGLSFNQVPRGVEKKPTPHVCIVGAGVAGMAAAQTLNEKGLRVTVIEKESMAGGKASSYVDEDSGYTVEHGIHGFFPVYRNLLRLLDHAGIGGDVFSDTVTTGVAGPNGMGITEIHKVRGPAPFFLWRLLPPGMFRIRDLVSAGLLLSRCIFLSVLRDTNSDDSTFRNLLRISGVSRRLADYLLIPYVKNLSYARGEEVSAWAAMEALNYYVLEKADDVKARWLRAGPAEVVFTPWMKELALRGVEFRLRTAAQNLIMAANRSTSGVAIGKVLRENSFGTTDRIWIESAGSQPLGLFWNAAEKSLTACEAKCTHEGCPLRVGTLKDVQGFRCDCHGGFFSKTGRVLQTPPLRDLPQILLKKTKFGDENFWEIGDAGAGHDPYVLADYTILAVDIKGVKRILSSEELKIPSLAQVSLLRTTSVMVLRLWFRIAEFNGPDSGVFAAKDLLDNFFVLGRFQSEFRVPGYIVVESHIGDSEKIDVFGDDELFAVACACLGKYFPELESAKLDKGRSKILRHADVFSLFAPGDLEKTPGVSAEDRPNLLLAGDWVRSDYRSWFMERSAITGIVAANTILSGEQLETTLVLEKDAPPLQYRVWSIPLALWRYLCRFFRRSLSLDR